MRHLRKRPRPRISLYVRSALALGLVLGVGAALVDASWTDQELASGTFTTASFVTQSMGNGDTTWASHSTTAATLSFGTAGGALYPGAPAVAASLGIRVAAGSIAGEVTAVTPPSSATVSGDPVLSTLQYTMYWDTSSTCTGTSTPSSAGGWLQQTAVSLSTAPSSFPAAGLPLAAGAAGAAGTPIYICLQVTLPAAANPPQSTTSATATWTFSAQNS